MFVRCCYSSYRFSSPDGSIGSTQNSWKLIGCSFQGTWIRRCGCVQPGVVSTWTHLFHSVPTPFWCQRKGANLLKNQKHLPTKDAQISISRMTINPLESSFPRQDTRSKVLEPSCRRLATPQLRDSKLPASSAHLGCLEIRPRGWMRYPPKA